MKVVAVKKKAEIDGQMGDNTITRTVKYSSIIVCTDLEEYSRTVLRVLDQI